MSRLPVSPPPRWTDGGAADPLDRRAGELLRLPAPPPLGPARRARIALRLASGRPPMVFAPARRVAVAAVVVVVAAGAVAAAAGLLRGWRAPVGRAVSMPRVALAPVPSPNVRAPGPDAPEAPASDRALAPARRPESAAAPVPARRARHRALIAGSGVEVAAVAAEPRRPTATEAPPPPPSPAPAAPAARAPAGSDAPAPPGPPALSEPRLVAAALASLHGGHDPRGALALLAEHRRRFPDGVLVSEARVAEVEALLALGRRAEALRVLDGLAVDGLPRGADLRILRAELRAEAGRCADAVADFNRCADDAACPPDVVERALYGRASCRARARQGAAARVDLQRYLARFPHGRFAAAVRRALDETP